jgi:hypothetical protein
LVGLPNGTRLLKALQDLSNWTERLLYYCGLWKFCQTHS